MGAVQFIENMDRTTLTISDDDFEQNVEAAVSAIAEKHRAAEESNSLLPTNMSEKGGLYTGESSSARPSFTQDGSRTPRRSTSNDGLDSGDDTPAIAGLLRTIQKPLSSIGRMFSDEPTIAGPSTPSHTPNTPPPNPISSRSGSEVPIPPLGVRQQLSAQEAAARQASAEAAEAQRLQRAEHNDVVETLAGMFPDLDREIISDVVHQKEGRLVFSHMLIPKSSTY